MKHNLGSDYFAECAYSTTNFPAHIYSRSVHAKKIWNKVTKSDARHRADPANFFPSRMVESKMCISFSHSFPQIKSNGSRKWNLTKRGCSRYILMPGVNCCLVYLDSFWIYLDKRHCGGRETATVRTEWAAYGVYHRATERQFGRSRLRRPPR